MTELALDPHSLATIRAGIDLLDRRIVELLSKRGELVRQAARFKSNPTEVAAPGRVEEVIAKVRSLAVTAGLEPEMTEATYRAMIAAFIQVERDAYQRGIAVPG